MATDIDLPVSRIAQKTFALVHATWDVAKAHELVQQLGPTHVIVQRTDGTPRFYLYTREQFLERLQGRPGASSIHAALNLHEDQAVALVEADTSAEAAPSLCVVHVGGRPVGFVDDRVLPTRPPTRGAGEMRRTRGPGPLESPSFAATGDGPPPVGAE